ncbi:MAG: hypothetical protein CMH60_00825 [Myxococcales bacterium]|nr:hypothetical protein [Myxococcales bacterium]|tara:strand:- start:48 stop:335 length:288 start_codon:yes stop_codon:yes gene_type:complete
MCKRTKIKNIQENANSTTNNTKGRLLSVLSLGFVLLLSSACAVPAQQQTLEAGPRTQKEENFRPLPSLSRIAFLNTMSQIFEKYGAEKNQTLAQR